MTRTEKTLITTGSIALAAVLVYSYRRSRSQKRLRTVAEHGYETAHDVLYPSKRNGYKTHYGPVLPS